MCSLSYVIFEYPAPETDLGCDICQRNILDLDVKLQTDNDAYNFLEIRGFFSPHECVTCGAMANMKMKKNMLVWTCYRRIE